MLQLFGQNVQMVALTATFSSYNLSDPINSLRVPTKLQLQQIFD